MFVDRHRRRKEKDRKARRSGFGRRSCRWSRRWRRVLRRIVFRIGRRDRARRIGDRRRRRCEGFERRRRWTVKKREEKAPASEGGRYKGELDCGSGCALELHAEDHDFGGFYERGDTFAGLEAHFL